MALQTLLRIPVSGPIFEKFDEQAKALNKPIEYLIAERLPQLAEADSEKPIVINDGQRRRLETALGRNVSSADELVRAMEHSMTLDVGGIHIELTPYLVSRLKSRCFGMAFDQFMALTVKRGLEEYCGLR